MTPDRKQFLYTARAIAKRKGVPLAPDLQVEWDAWQAERAASKAATKARKAARDKAWRQSRRALLAARWRERYATDPAFRAKCNAKRLAHYHAKKVERTEAEKEATRLRRIAALVKARAAKPKAEPKAKPAPKPRHIIYNKPGRILASLGWK